MFEWKKSRSELFERNKQQRVVERKHATGITGIDCPLRANTQLYQEQYRHYKQQQDRRDNHAALRHDYLEERTRSCDALRMPYAKELPDPEN